LVALTVVLQVVLRYIFKVPLFGLEEFSRLIAVWVYFLGAIFGTKWDAHVQGDVAGRIFSTDRSRSIIKAIAWIISLSVCFLFLYHSATYSIWLYGTGERTTGLWWPRIYSVGSMLFGAFFMTLYSIANVIKYSGAAINGLKPTSGGTP
jgi:TRAP-type C4-dicarboxylate transport system permease small subunit